MSIYHLDDSRIYRALTIGKEQAGGMIVKPFISKSVYIGDFFETPASVLQNAVYTADAILHGTNDDSASAKEEIDKSLKAAAAKMKEIRNLTSSQALKSAYGASFSMMHPYALLRLSGVRQIGAIDSSTVDDGEGKNNLVDSAFYRRWYEIDAGARDTNDDPNAFNRGIDFGTLGKDHYSKNPTTAELINWSSSDKRGRYPYAFQDFVFCKHWNKIQNNRLITLRRYPAPVLDNVEPANYTSTSPMSFGADGKLKENANTAERNGALKKDDPFAPLATAVTYFGEETENNLADMLAFSVGYNWEEMNADIHSTSSTQIEQGQGIFNSQAIGPFLNTGLQQLTVALGIFGDFTGQTQIHPEHAVGLPPDPYSSGPYENRIIGPVNVINNVYKRKRGLKFTNDGLTIKFEYVARPIANVNNKAILLDLLANILAMTSSSGKWFGGAHRYRVENPAIYPWRNLNSLNKLYQGKIFGSDGAFNEMIRTFYNEKNKNFVTSITKEIIDGITSCAKDVVNAITGKDTGGSESEENKAKKEKLGLIWDKGVNTASRAIAAHMLKGQQAPWLQGASALLTGDPVGDWHLTIGNPMNPIAMVGNLIVDNCDIKFSNELGPDDFPIGFTAKIKLMHAMGRDKDAVESMFNRGNGRIYVLSDKFRSTADYETTVDSFTGVNNELLEKVQVNSYGQLATTGSFAIAKSVINEHALSKDKQTVFGNYTPHTLTSFSNENAKQQITNIYRTTEWAMAKIL